MGSARMGGALMDTGNFLEDPYDSSRKSRRKTVFVQAQDL